MEREASAATIGCRAGMGSRPWSARVIDRVELMGTNG
jgi:hypothetical protein